MKRFTETNKWSDPWYRKLSPQAKHLLNYLRDKCDSAGVVEIDYAAISFHVGEPIQEQHLAELESRLQHMPNGKVLMPKFVGFQYGILSGTCPAHKPVLKLIDVHGLNRVGIEYRYPNATLALPLETSTKIPIAYPSDRVQEKEKEKEKDLRGVQGGRLHGIPATVDEVIRFGRTTQPPVPEDRCRAFFAHYEGQAKTNHNGDVFWITSGDTVVTNWKVKLPEFRGGVGFVGKGADGRPPKPSEFHVWRDGRWMDKRRIGPNI